MLNEKIVKKLDLSSIKTLKNEININSNTGKKNSQISLVGVQSSKRLDDKEIFIDNLITKDYEQYMEFMSQEDFFCDKLVNLQNPYFYIPMNLKQNQEKVNENIKKNKIEQDNFFNKMCNKFGDSSHRSMIQSSSYNKKK